MTKRVSIKGAGAEIFFGQVGRSGEAPRHGNEAQRSRRAERKHGASDPRNSKTDSPPARQQPSQTDSKMSRQLSVPQATAPMLDRATIERLLGELGREHRTHNTFRYSQEELDAVRDIVYEMEVRRGVKISRNDVMRIALNYFIEDYRVRGDDSMIAQLFKDFGRLPSVRRRR